MNASLTKLSVTRVTARNFAKKKRVEKTLVDANAEAAEIIAAAHARAAEIEAEANSFLDQTKTSAIDKADSEIEAHVNEEKQRRLAEEFERLTTLSKALQADFDAHDEWLTELVVTSVRSIIGNIPEQEKLIGLVEQALSEKQNRWSLELRVNPEDAVTVRKTLKPHFDETNEDCAIVVRPEIALGQMQLASGGGICDIGLDVQLEMLECVLRGSFQSEVH